VRFDAVINFVALTYTKDAIGQEVAVPTSRQVHANEFSRSAGEFYTAGAQGLKPERQYQVRAIDYEDEPRLVADGIEFAVIRVDRRGEWTRLICQRNVANTTEVGS
jgi:hypothetical protein